MVARAASTTSAVGSPPRRASSAGASTAPPGPMGAGGGPGPSPVREEPEERPEGRRRAGWAEVDALHVRQRPRVALEFLSERREQPSLPVKGGALEVGHDPIGFAALADIEGGGGLALDVLPEHPRHEQRVVADLLPNAALAERIEIGRREVPRALGLQAQADHRVDAATAGVADGVELIGPGEARQQ